MSDINYQTLASELLGQMNVRTKGLVSATPGATMGHGPGGLFSSPGLSRPVFSAMILPHLGIQNMIPVRPSRDFNPLHGIMTGVTASSGANPVGVCDDPPSAGLMKLCTHSFVFGRQSRQTKVYDLDTFGRLTNRGEFTDLQLFGNPLVNPNAGVPTMPGVANPAQALNNEIAKALFELAVSWSRDFARLTYAGTPTNNTAGGGYKEFYGLDTLINTGYRDAETGVACPAADSYVRSFGNLNIATNSAALVRELTIMYRNLNYLAAEAALIPVQWVISMRYSLFYEITEIWPCQYLSYRCTLTSGSTQFINSADSNAMRDDMRGDMYNRTGQYLLIDGQRVPVVIDDAIAETEGLAGGSFSSGIYMVPLTVLGGIPVTFWEYFDYDVPGGALEASRIFAPDGSFYSTDNGRFMWARKPPTNYCVQLMSKTEPRLILETPYLAGRLTNVLYAPLSHERSPFTDSDYFVDGGKVSNSIAPSGPSYFSPTA